MRSSSVLTSRNVSNARDEEWMIRTEDAANHQGSFRTSEDDEDGFAKMNHVDRNVGDNVDDYDDDYDYDDNDKNSKIKLTQRAQMRKLLILFFFITAGCFIWIISSTSSYPNEQQQRQYNTHLITHSSNHGLTTSNGSKKPSVVQFTPVEDGPTDDRTEQELVIQVQQLDRQVRARKAIDGVMMEVDPQGLALTTALQQVTRKLLLKRYGRHPAYRVIVDLEFPPTMPDFTTKGKDGKLIIEMAPIDLIPVSVFYFLEMARTWQRGMVHRNAGHVLQIQSYSAQKQHMPFQEYSPDFPHKRGTAGYAGRPSGPGWYISIQDNTKNHGPGSQQNHNPHEADALFGTVVQGMDDVVPRIHSIPQRGWLDREHHVAIPKMTIFVADEPGKFVEWVPTSTI